MSERAGPLRINLCLGCRHYRVVATPDPGGLSIKVDCIANLIRTGGVDEAQPIPPPAHPHESPAWCPLLPTDSSPER